MSIVHQTQHATVHAGDCLDVLRELPDESVHAVITDPPYGLSNTTPAQVTDCLREWATGNTEYVPATKRGFMGKDWDSFVPPPAVWEECLRVLKPGGHLLAFAGSRTQDLMGMSIRLAGFDILDNFAWLYGTGFPKSANVSKAIDKTGRRDYVFAAQRLGMTIPGNNLHDWTKAEHSPGDAWWEKFKAVLPAEEWARLEREVIAERRTTDRRNDGTVVGLGHSGNADITVSATPDAVKWEGWGTALKPAFEPVIMARKPFRGTVAANVLQHGTGALNIDASRVGEEERCNQAGGSSSLQRVSRVEQGYRENVTKSVGSASTVTGRFPANVLLDESQAAELDQQSGTLSSGAWNGKRNGTKTTDTYGAFDGGDESPREASSGGASRFFYCAKAPKAERPNVDGTAHPTVKPLTLMRYLIRMVTPPGGVVLDPFAGSGTTLEAATHEGFESIGIEAQPDYLPLIAQRLERSQVEAVSEPAQAEFDFTEDIA